MSKARLSASVFNYVYGILLERPAIIDTFPDITNESFDDMRETDYKAKAKDNGVKT